MGETSRRAVQTKAPSDTMVVVQRRAPGIVMIFDIQYKSCAFSRLGNPGALRGGPASFSSAWGRPLGAAEARSILKFEGNTQGFLMNVLFVSSGLGSLPGSVEIPYSEQRGAQGTLPKR